MTTLLIILAFALLWYYAGKALLTLLRQPVLLDYHTSFAIAARFFAGALIFAALFAGIGQLTGNARIGLGSATAVGLLALAVNPSVLKVTKASLYAALRVALVLGFFILLFTWKSLLPMPAYFVSHPELASPFSGFGAIAHSFRSGNITYYIAEQNELPYLNQHSAHALLGSIPSLVGQPTPQWSLMLWLAVFVSFISIAAYGLARTITGSVWLSLLAPLILLLGNTVLSLFYSGVVDSDNALIFANSVETVFGIGTFLLISLLVYESAVARQAPRALFAIIAAAGFVWNIASSPLIILCFILFSFWWIALRRERFYRTFFTKGIISLVAGTIVGAYLLGGMLALQEPRSATEIPGIMNLKREGTVPVAFRFPRTGETAPNTPGRLAVLYEHLTGARDPVPTVLQQNTPADSTITTSIKSHSVLFGAAKIARSIQLVFFPLLCFGLLAALLWWQKIALASRQRQLLTAAWWSSLTLFMVGWMASTMLIVYGYTWELSKFFSIGIFYAMLLLGITLQLLIQNAASTIHKALYALLFLVIIFGPTVDIVGVKLIGNAYYQPVLEPWVPDTFSTAQYRTLTLTERLHFLFESNGYYGTEHDEK